MHHDALTNMHMVYLVFGHALYDAICCSPCVYCVVVSRVWHYSHYEVIILCLVQVCCIVMAKDDGTVATRTLP